MSKKTIMAILAFFALLTIIAVVGVEAQPSGNQILTIVSKPSQPSYSGGYPAINFPPQQDNASSGIVFSIDRDGQNSTLDGQAAAGGALNLNFFTLFISVYNRSIYLVPDTSSLNRTIQQVDSYPDGRFFIWNYHVTDFYNVTFFSLSAWEHQVNVYLGNSDTNGNFWVYIYASSSFVVDSQATPIPSPSPPAIPSPSPSPTAIPNPNPSYPHVTAPLTAFPTPITSPTAPELSYCTVAFLMILAAIVIVCMKRKVNTL